MAPPRCDFYDWAAHRGCDQPARWVTHQSSQTTGRPAQYYCDAHRPPRAQPLTAPPVAPKPRKAR